MASSHHKYENVQLAGEHEHDHDSRSSTEVESLIGDEKSWHAHRQERERKSKRSQLSSILRSSRWMLDTTLLLIIVALLVRNEMKEPVQDQWQLLGDMTGVGPRFPQKLERFEYDTSYAPMNTSEFFTNETLAKWNNLMPSTFSSPSLHALYMLLSSCTYPLPTSNATPNQILTPWQRAWASNGSTTPTSTTTSPSPSTGTRA